MLRMLHCNTRAFLKSKFRNLPEAHSLSHSLADIFFLKRKVIFVSLSSVLIKDYTNKITLIGNVTGIASAGLVLNSKPGNVSEVKC